jgi:hypothetical protein
MCKQFQANLIEFIYLLLIYADPTDLLLLLFLFHYIIFYFILF